METRFNGHRMQVAWEDARFFSIDGVLGSQQQCTYTLSGEQGSVIWLQLISETQRGLYYPALPFDLYRQQSNALLGVIAGKTGLPLYDMRLPANKWYL